MTRPIKFRAWCEENKSFIYMVWNPSKGSWDFQLFPLVKGMVMNPKIGELQQSTGLLDKNGVEIYEGDVVEYQYLNTLKKETRKAEVKLMPIGDVNRNLEAYYPFCYSISGSYKERDREITECYLTPSSDCEIIGNIYSNPTLIKQQ